MEAFEADAGMSDGDSEKPAKLEAATKAADLAPDPEVATLLRFKMAGVDEDLGRLHDLTCPAYHPEQVVRYHPYADLGQLIDSRAWQRKTLAAAAGPLEHAMKAQEVWQAALLLKTADTADLNQWRLELHKAFRDANPGPGSFPTPGSVSPQRYNRPVLTAGRAADAVDYGAPNSSPQVATTAPNASSFDRPPLSAGHQTPSPSHMKGDGQYPSEHGVPTQLSYAQAQRAQSRVALERMHEHLARQFPTVCPIDLDLAPVQPEHHPVPVPAGIGKNAEAEHLATAEMFGTAWLQRREELAEEIRKGRMTVEDALRIAARDGQPESSPPAAAFKATPEDADAFADADIYKAFKKMRKKLGKRVLSGKMTVDEARAKLGRQFTQKAAEDDAAITAFAAGQVRKGVMSIGQAREQLNLPPLQGEAASPSAANRGTDPEVIKAAVTEATTELKDLLIKQQEDFTTKLAEQQRVIDAIADQPDPSTAAFSGLAFQPQTIKSRRPAGVPDQAEYAARAQAMIRRNLENTYTTHSNPYVREKAAEALAQLGVEATPMT